ncbi:LysR family transcriptional regulator [Collinsella intestinalis]|uniref:LysR family transcriptional regulator n=1 Tax=Collinsella intestinalis TaxID=147207 RepID=UPI00195E5C0D|nr:LysR family transcriptional regulator [Collinsella intestinalis]MBM6943158.1 LysR family transcriptional regulator [Collinsella intestinalis]
MDVSQLRYFVETVRTGSYRRAAGNLYLTAQGVAQSVKRLETELGVRLFEKRGRTIIPTEKGMELYPHAQELLAGLLAFEARAKSKSSTSGRTITRLAITEAPLRGRLFEHGALRQNLEREMPNVTVSFVQNEMAIQALHDNLVGAAVVLGRPDNEGIVSMPFCNVRPFVIAAPDAFEHAEHEIALSELENRKMAMPTDTAECYRFLSTSLEAHRVSVRFAVVESTVEDHLAFIANGGLIFAYGHCPLLSCDNVTKLALSRNEDIVFPFFFCTKMAQGDAGELHTFLLSQVRND